MGFLFDREGAEAGGAAGDDVNSSRSQIACDEPGVGDGDLELSLDEEGLGSWVDEDENSPRPQSSSSFVTTTGICGGFDAG
jgi:hypothetical protein